MFKTKLSALEYHSASNVNIDDPKEFRNLILWLEDQKIRHYKIEDRAGLREINNTNEWTKAFEKYKEDLGCPKVFTTQVEILSWILGYATKLEYGDHADKYRGVSADMFENKGQSQAPTIKSTNPFDNLDFTSKDFEAGVRNLALRFDMPHHPDHLVLLQGIARLARDNFSVEALKEQIPEGKPFPIFDGAGFNYENEDMETGARILRLLQIQSVRELQTLINETIVTVQNLTADPKTDSKLGKVGV
ncbi:RNA transcription, translation and transport factor protein [Culicoides brevitarsis]|uniref:RNA transcription, translation and transport factor protein n=1 Tax=Culicoides brevitarsis TaxID=469753 RepID=UPI00307C2E9C